MLLVACWSCSSKKKYAETNLIYQRQVEQIAEEIKSIPTNPTVKKLPDSASLLPDPRLEGQREEAEWVGTINFNMRRPNFIILHHTAQDSVQQTFRTFTLAHTEASAHYVIGKDGKIYQMLNDYLRAWHAGSGKWQGITDLNSISLGIELDNNGKAPYPDVQIQSLCTLLDSLCTNYKIPRANIIGHGDVSPSRKIDPDINFPWRKLAERGFGLWYDEQLFQAPPTFNPMDGLLILGYDIKRPDAAILAFKRHFLPEYPLDITWTDHALAVLYNLYLKCRDR
ncbi:N-acetylmuramoyl-L-alanine amidase [Olivibacter sitiensis]|uniref:N-acetylmuramoyl-L-alanine amidase n=1 Tax=Olivibacter sitiensis TaxID=376470 RepID=UPI001FE0285A|nr:N-acetylmuramoyl-L-alanine amidase [Olivibacter sitiensis]